MAKMRLGCLQLRNPKVRARLRELVDTLAERQMNTRETLVAEYDQVIAGAHEEKQDSAATTAIKEKQKLLELDPASKSVNVNINATYNQMTDDELRFELASLVNAVRAAKGQPLLELPGPCRQMGRDRQPQLQPGGILAYRIGRQT
jgi:hypothetical protein